MTATGTNAAAVSQVNLGIAAGAAANIGKYGAKCDARNANDGAMSSTGTTLTSASGAFTPADAGKVATVAGAGAQQSFGSATIAAAGTGYIPWETYPFNTTGLAQVIATQVVSATVNAGGTGGTPGTQTVTGATTGATYSVTVSGGGVITAVLSVVTPGSYNRMNATFVDGMPVQLTSENVTGASLSGASLNTVMGLQTVVGSSPLTTSPPSNPLSLGTGSGSGTGGTLTATWPNRALHATIAAYIDSTHVRLATAASATVSGAIYYVGTDDTTPFNNAANDLIGASGIYGQGGHLQIPVPSVPGGAGCLIDQAWLVPYTGTAPPKMRGPLVVEGVGTAWDGSEIDGAPLGGSHLIMTYDGFDGLHPGKIDARGGGTLMFDNVSIEDGLVDTIPLAYFTNTTPIATNTSHFRGSAACYGTTCNQDALVFGGTGGGGIINTDNINAPFQGYLGVIASKFDRVRRVGTYQSAANGITFRDFSVPFSAGSHEPFGSPFMMLASGAFGNSGNLWYGGTIEVQNYLWGVTAEASTSVQEMHELHGTYIGDSNGYTQGALYYAGAGNYSLFEPAWVDSGVLGVTGPGKYLVNYIGNSASSGNSRFANPIDIGGGHGQVVANIWGGATNSADGSALFFKNGTSGTTIGVIGNGDAIAGGAYDNTFVIGATAAGPNHLKLQVGNLTALDFPNANSATMGLGTGGVSLTLNGGTGSNVGSFMQFEKAGGQSMAIGNLSAFIGGSSNDGMIRNVNGIGIYHNNSQTAYFDTSGNYTVNGGFLAPGLASSSAATTGALCWTTGGNVTVNTVGPCTDGSAGSGAVQTISYQPGLLTAVNNTQSAFVKFVKASTVSNIIGSASSFTCTGNPVLTLTDTTTSTTIGTVTVTASGAAFTGTVSNAAVAAGDVLAWSISSGTCAAIDIAGTAQVTQN